MKKKRDLVMSISLSALEHLGINLYSNVPSVLSEIVANAWDADAKRVDIEIDHTEGSIVIRDDGLGMTRDEVIDRFLTVGFKRRDEPNGEETPSGRKPMGRKGIGKLSLFSIARTAEIFTRSGKEKTAFGIDRDAIKNASKNGKLYAPKELETFPSNLKHGTLIKLSDLSKSLAGMTIEGLRRRVARRFSVIGPKFDFIVYVNGQEVTPVDRGYQQSIEYLWTYGSQKEFEKLCANLARSAVSRTSAVSSALKDAGISLKGWIGTVAKPDQLKDSEGENLNRIAVFMRGKLAQEDILASFGQKEIYADYIIGELHCDELDTDGQGDIATSSRQSLKEDDPRFEALRSIVISELRHVAGKWSELRRAHGIRTAVKVPAVSDWINNLRGETRRKAEQWVGRLNTIRVQDDHVKKELLKASILAFESYRRKEELGRLESLKDESLSEVLKVFEGVDDLELSYYGQIVRGRIEVIRKLQSMLQKNEKELVLRDYIFEHLWLLDPSWERTKGTEHAETNVTKFLKKNTASLKPAEKKARIDIGYRTASAKHVIVELKRASISVPLDDLIKQIRKYRDGVRKILEKTTYKDWPLEVICLVGKPPPEWNDASGTGKDGVELGLRTVDARLVFYDQLLDNAQQAYRDYLEAHVKVDKLWAVFDAIDDFAPSAPHAARKQLTRAKKR